MSALAYSTEQVEKTIEFAITHKLSVFPLKADKLPIEKWTPLQTNRASIKKMASWINGSTKGMGLVTGSLNGIVVLDIDVKKGKNGWKHIKGKELPITPAVRTQNGGTHYYYKYPQGMEIRNAKDMYGTDSGVDIRGEGGFVVMPFTKGYEWVEGLEFDTVPLAEIPEWLLKDYTNYKNNKSKKSKKEPVQIIKPVATPIEAQSKPVKVIIEPKTTQATGQNIKAYFKDNETVIKLLPLLGLENEQINGAGFNCVLPSKTIDTRPSASLFKMEDGTIAYRDWRAGAEEADYYSLAEVYASQHYKEKRKLNGPELTTWSNRLLVEAGIIQTTPVEALELPESLRKKKSVVKVYEGFQQLLAIKNLYLENEGTAFSFRFAAAWCGVSSPTVQIAMTQLQAFGYIKMTGKEGIGIRAVNVYKLYNPNA